MANPTEFSIKIGTTGPPLRATLLDPDDQPLDPSSIASAVLRVEGLLASDGVMVSEGAGVYRYDWVPGDTATVGRYKCWVIVTFVDGVVQAIPNRGFNEVHVEPLD